MMVRYHLGAMSQGQLTLLLLLNGVDVFQRSNDDGTVPPWCNESLSGTTYPSLAPKWC